MKQETETRIVEYITAHPNQSSSEIANGLGLSHGTVKPQLKALAIAHKITRILADNASGIGRQEFRYFPPDKRPKTESAAQPEAEFVETGSTHAQPPGRVELLPASERIVDVNQVISDFAQRIAESVVAQALPQIIPKLREEMAKAVAEATSCIIERPGGPKPDIAPQPEPKKLPSIFVGGLQPSATSMLSKEFTGVADLRFVTPEDHASMWKSKAANADHAIIMTGFVGHKHVEAVQSTGIKPILVHGGMTHLRDKILGLCVK